MDALYGSSQLDGGKTKWRERLTRQEKVEPYCRENFTFFNGSNLYNNARFQPIVDFYDKLIAQSDNNNLFSRDDSQHLTYYTYKIMDLELVIQDYINLHQRVNHDFYDDLTIMDVGLKDAIDSANNITNNLNYKHGLLNDDVNIVVLKCLDLNLSFNDLLTTISSAKKTYELDWFDASKLINCSRGFYSLDDLDYVLTREFNESLPECFYKILRVLIIGFVQKKFSSIMMEDRHFDMSNVDIIAKAKEKGLINESTFFLMGFVLMSLYSNKIKIGVSVYGDNNKTRNIYYVLKSFIESLKANEGKYIDYSFDVEDFVYNKFSQLASSYTDYCIENNDVEFLAESMRSYSNYRVMKYVFIESVYKNLYLNDVKYIDELIELFVPNLELLKVRGKHNNG